MIRLSAAQEEYLKKIPPKFANSNPYVKYLAVFEQVIRFSLPGVFGEAHDIAKRIADEDKSS